MNYHLMSVKELKAQAKKFNISRYSNLRKIDLILILEDFENVKRHDRNYKRTKTRMKHIRASPLKKKSRSKSLTKSRSKSPRNKSFDRICTRRSNGSLSCTTKNRYPTESVKTCSYQLAPKYHTNTRSSPPYPGTPCCGKIIKHNDKLYKSIEYGKKGACRWVLE